MSKKILTYLGCFSSLLLIWEGASHLFPHFLFILPPPSEVFQTLWEMRTRLWFHTSATLKEMCGGFLIALCAAFPLAWAMMRYKTSRDLLQPLFIVIQCLPMFTLAPIMVIWFGWSYTAIVIPTALMIFFPLTLNIYQGLRSTPEDLVEFFRSNQATSWQTFFKLRLPWAVPHIFAGFRISAAIAGVGAVAGEWAGAQIGLGILMLESRRNAELEVTFAALFCLVLISTLLYGLILYCEKIALPPRRWRLPLISKLFHKPIRQYKKRLALPFILLIVLLLSLSGCQKQSEQTRLLLDWLPNPNHVPLYAGLEKGYFAEEGIDLKIQKMHDNGGGISYLTSRQCDLLVAHMPGTFKALGQGAQIKLVGLLIKKPLCGLVYRKDLEVTCPQDLTGTIAGYCIGEHKTSFLDYLLEAADIQPKAKRNVSVDLISSMGTKSVDFIWGAFWNIEPAQLHSLGVETGVITMDELGIPPYYEMVIITNQDYPSASAEAFRRALQKSLHFCQTHPDEAFYLYLTHHQDRRPKTLAWEREAWAMTLPLLAKDQTIDHELVGNFYSWQLDHEILGAPFALDEALYTVIE